MHRRKQVNYYIKALIRYARPTDVIVAEETVCGDGASLSDNALKGIILTYAYDFPISAQHMLHNRATCTVRKGKSNR